MLLPEVPIEVSLKNQHMGLARPVYLLGTVVGSFFSSSQDFCRDGGTGVRGDRPFRRFDGV